MIGKIQVKADELKEIVKDYFATIGYDVKNVEVTGDTSQPVSVEFEDEYRKESVAKKKKLAKKPTQPKAKKEKQNKEV